MFQQSAANLNFFPYRLHNETLDKKINASVSRNFTTSAYLLKAHGSNSSAAVPA